MTINTTPIAVGEPILRSTILAMAQQLNSLMDFQMFEASGIFTVPNGCHRIKVSACAQGGPYRENASSPFEGGHPGIDSLWASKIIDVEEGQTFTVTMNATSSSFGSALTVYSPTDSSQSVFDEGLNLQDSYDTSAYSPPVGADFVEIGCPYMKSTLWFGSTYYIRRYGAGSRQSPLSLESTLAATSGLVLVQW